MVLVFLFLALRFLGLCHDGLTLGVEWWLKFGLLLLGPLSVSRLLG